MTDSENIKNTKAISPAADALTPCVHTAAESDETIVHKTFSENAEKQDFSGAPFRACRFVHCNLNGCEFTGCDFTQTVFENCNFSGSIFRDCTFYQCTVQNCKWTGADFTDAFFKDCTVKNCALNLAAFDNCKVSHANVTDCDCTGTSLCGIHWKAVHAADCKLVQNNFFKTALAGADLSACRFEAPTVSNDLAELRGAKMSPLQFEELAGLLNIKLL